MGRKGQKKGKGGDNSGGVTEAVRIRVSRILEQFRASNDQVYTFEPGLSNQERAAIHEMCRKMGMISKSSGKGGKRRLSVFKSKKNKGSVKREDELVTCLQFSGKTERIMQDHFTRFPPQDDELSRYVLRTSTERVNKGQWKKDSSFCKPSRKKSEIIKKVEMLKSKIIESAQLRKVAEDRAKLPIASFKDVITSTLETHQVVLISGETGCGKTTQVPQYILDYMWSKGEACKIVCTQPRRISAISVAERIAYERGEAVGENIGYKIRLESKGGKQSSILFCTNGVLLRLLIGRSSNLSKISNRSNDDPIQEITHIIVDEIHERDRFSDFMLAIIRDLMPAYPHLRMVLMSATIDAERFSSYFGGCSIIRVPGFNFPVKVFYLEDVLSFLSSKDNNHLNYMTNGDLEKDASLTEDFKNALDESIDLALCDDDFDPLLGLISSELKPTLYNYQHSSTGVSPLMVFAGKGRVGDVCMLLSLGADCTLSDKDGSSALDWAKQANEVEIFEIIKKHKEKDKSKSSEQEELTKKYLASINPEHIDTVLIERLLKKICTDSTEGAILVFLPGWEDINQTKEKLAASSFFQDPSKFVILCLHSMIPSAEQKKVFKRPPAGVRKIILSTNISETAITIDDVIYVIDSGRMKEKSYDPYNNVSTLHSSWISKASARQREGRAGRCQPGTCYHLYSRVRALSLLDYQVPEIKRMPIEELCLQVKLLDPQCQIIDFLQKTLDPPVNESVLNAINVLKNIGALTENEELTDIGEKLGSLPVHPSTSKMLLFAILMNCLDPALTLACSADYRGPFVLPMAPDERKRATAAKVELSSLYGGYSDQLAVVAAFDCWKRAKERGQESQFCSRYFVSSGTMNMLCGMRKQLQNELAKHGFIPDDVSICSLNAHDPGIVRAVLMAGNYPMVGRLLPRQKNGRQAVVETVTGAKVRLHPHSSNLNMPSSKYPGSPLIIYDEITRGDGGMYIKNTSLVGPLPLLLLATEMAVAPSNENDNGSDEDEDEDASSIEEDEMEIKMSSEHHGKEIMSLPDNTVSAVIDRWLRFKATALDVAQIYCLRERLATAILFKVKYPSECLPPELGQSMYAISCILSYDGMPSTPLHNEATEPQSLEVNEASRERFSKQMGFRLPSGFLKSLFFSKGQSSVPNKIGAQAHGKSFSSSARTYAPPGPTLQPANSLQASTSSDSASRTGSFKRRR